MELLPSYVSTAEGGVDLRYFLVASGNFTNARGEIPEDEDQEYKKKICVDDLEVPSVNRLTTDQLFKNIQKYFSLDQSNRLRQAYNKVSNEGKKGGGVGMLLNEFETVLGTVKGFKYFWAFALASPHLGNEMQAELKRQIAELPFRSETCVLSKHSKSYRSIFKSLNKKLADFLNRHKDEMKSFPEEKLNKMITSIYNNEIGDLIQGRLLQHYISAHSISILMHIFFTDANNYEEMFDECPLEDLLVVFIYWSIIKVKTTSEATTTPGFRGVDWIKETSEHMDLSFIKIEAPEVTKAKKQAKKEKILTNKDEFPSLVDVNTDTNQRNLLEILKAGRNKEGFVSFKKATPIRKPAPAPAPVPSRPEPKPHVPSRPNNQCNKISYEEHWPTLGDIPLTMPVYRQPSPPPVKPKPQEKQKPLTEDDFPSLGIGAPADGVNLLNMIKGNQSTQQKKKPQTATNQHKPAVDQSKSIAAYNVQKGGAKKEKKEEEAGDEFPSLGGGFGGGAQEIIPPATSSQNNKAQNKKSQPQPAVQKEPEFKPVKIGISNYEEAEDFDSPKHEPEPEVKQDTQSQKNKSKKGGKNKKEEENDFPCLPATGGPLVLETKLLPHEAAKAELLKRKDLTEDDFPGLGSSKAEEKKEVYKGPQGGKKYKPAKAKAFSELKEADDDTPVQQEEPDKNKKAKQNFEEISKNLDKITSPEPDFPTLGGAFGGTAQQKPFNPILAAKGKEEDFPTLGGGKKGKRK